MTASAFIRKYMILRPAAEQAAGFARLEGQHGRGRMVIHAQVPSYKGATLRALLLSGDEETGAVMDLGLMHLDARRQGQMQCMHLPLKQLGCQGGYHTLALCTDWPEAQMLLYTWLTERPPCALWQVQGMVSRHLALPAQGSAPAPVQEQEPALPQPHVLGLQPLHWPERWAELKAYFDTLPPCCPFDRPGWRFVTAKLQGPAPAETCAIGMHTEGHEVRAVMYALPGSPAPRPPEGLEGYAWRKGKHGKGYWVLEQTVEA